MNNKTLSSENNPEDRKKENWLKWLIITIPALIVVFIVSYALQWVLWKWLWLAIPIWVLFYFINRKYGTNYHSRIIPAEVKKHIDRDDFKEWCRQSSKDDRLIISDPMPITFWERFRDKLKRYLP